MSTKFKDLEQEEEKEDGVAFEIPDTSAVLQRLRNAEQAEVRAEHLQIMEEEEKTEEGKAKAKKRKKPKGGSICFCGVEGCTIGEFVERNG